MITRRALLGAGAAGAAAAAVPATRALGLGAVPWSRLDRQLTGDLVLPSDARYATAKQLDLMQFDAISPQAVAYCADARDVALCLAFAQQNGLVPTVRSGGHSAAGYSTGTGLVVDVSRLNSVRVGGGSVTLGPGAQNVDVLNTLADSGLALVGGACPTVAAGGFVQGGGLGFLTRTLGMTCDALTSATVVLASGQTVTASAQEHPDLFWALRGGGGGNFGVVTSYTLTPTALSQVATAQLGYAYDQALDMLDGYARWLVDCPRTIGSAAVVTLVDAAPGHVPAPAIIVVSTGTPVELDAELARLESLTGGPASRQGSVLPYRDLMTGIFRCTGMTVEECHRADVFPRGQLPRTAFALERSRLVRDAVPRDGWARVLALFDEQRVSGGQTHGLQVLPIDGAVRDLDRTATAFVHRDSRFSVNFQAYVAQGQVTDGLRTAAKAWVDAGFAAVDPLSSGETYQNFVDPELADWKTSYYAENYPRLVRTKNRYDPNGLFGFAQGIR
ncbi:FAD-binding oxidoreductase [Streptomyces sp. NPDC017868]|uniref:FAD-binding oxidoreductase n=1 Tax=Streptomyces sp. NPDC017868 TaxID=3365014 RepID=UPI0037B2F630